MAGYKLAVDTGGTFTDLCLMDTTGTMHIVKEASTPENPAQAILTGLQKITQKASIAPTAIQLILHGTTVATNAILEQKGAKVALITTKGFKDVIFIGRQNRPHLYHFWALKPPQLLPRRNVLEINERILADGSVAVAPTAEEIENLMEQLRVLNINSVAVCLLHAYANPVHELLIKDSIKQKLPHLSVTLSQEMIPEFKEYERTSTTVINALVRPKVDHYLEKLTHELKAQGVNGPLFIMQSNGGVITTAKARRQSARTVLSGPAGGVLAGVQIARQTGYKNIITTDMGGTSTDICLIYQGEPRYTTAGSIGGHPLQLPMLDMHTIGAGGGSIGWIDPGTALRVGPHSAGAVPGPACYNLGGQEPTITDANMVLGRLDPDYFSNLPGVSARLAHTCIEQKISKRMGMTVQEAAEGMIEIVNAAMIRAIRVISVQKGFDPRDFTLMAFGGAGPLHAVELARELGIPRVLVPPYPGVTSAQGMLGADVRQDYAATYLVQLTLDAGTGINAKLAQLIEQGQQDLKKQGFTPDNILLTCYMDLRYRGQSYEITLPIPGKPLIAADITAIQQRFHRRHKREYGYDHPHLPVELVTLRLAACGILPAVDAIAKPQHQNTSSSVAIKNIYLSGQKRSVPVFQREQMGTNLVLEGPALITQPDTTILIWPDSRAKQDRFGHLIIETGVQ